MPLFGPPNIQKLKFNDDVLGLIKALNYRKDSRIRKVAAEVLGQIGGAAPVESLIAAARTDEADEVQQVATMSLIKIGAHAVEPLIAGLADKEQTEGFIWRWSAAQALGHIGDSRAVLPLVAELHDLGADDHHMRQYAATALGHIGQQQEDAKVIGQIAQALETALDDKNMSVKQAAAEGLIRIDAQQGNTELGIQLTELLLSTFSNKGYGYVKGASQKVFRIDTFWKEAKITLQLVARVGVPAINPLFTALQSDAPISTRAGAMISLAGLSLRNDDASFLAQVIELLITALKDSDNHVASAARFALAMINLPATESLLKILEDTSDVDLRNSAAVVLGEIGDPRSVEPLIEALKIAEPSDRRLYLNKALAKVGTPAVAPLINALKDESVSVRWPAFEALLAVTGKTEDSNDWELWNQWWEKQEESRKVKYIDIGNVEGTCWICRREVYAVPGAVTVDLVKSDQEEKIKATAMWCPNCNTLYCVGCAQKSHRKCPACWVAVVDQYNR